MDSQRLLCVVCSAQVTDRNFSEDTDNSSNYLYFSQFCGELEKCEWNNYNIKPFNAKQFFHDVDLASSQLLVCEECKKLISEAMEIRGSLEKCEMEVLRLQIELLLKLKELDKWSGDYFGKMNSIYDKVKMSLSEDLPVKRINFGATNLSRDEVNLFREKILDVVANLALFRDDLKRKLVNPSCSEPETADPTTEPVQPEVDLNDDLANADDFPPMQIDTIKNDDPISQESQEDNGFSDNDNYNDHDDDFSANEEEADDSLDSDDKNDKKATNVKKKRSSISKPPPPKRKRIRIRNKNPQKRSRIIDNLPQLPFSIPDSDISVHKKTLLQTILIPPSPPNVPLEPPFSVDTTYTFLLQKYPWSYNPTTSDSDTLTLGGTTQIRVTEISEENEKKLSLECLTCNYTTVYDHTKQFKNRTAIIFSLVKKMFEHCVTSHLDGLGCPFEGKCSTAHKRGNLKDLCTHLKRCHSSVGGGGGGPFHCSICGQGLGRLKDCLEHEETHKDKKERDYVTCDKCGMSLLRTSLRAHKRKSCGVERPPRAVCQICGVSVSQEWVLKAHMLRKHAGEEERRFECEVCGKKYVMEMDLKNHRKYRHGIYPEEGKGTGRECRKGCGKRFTWLSGLCKHEEKCDGVKR